MLRAIRRWAYGDPPNLRRLIQFTVTVKLVGYLAAGAAFGVALAAWGVHPLILMGMGLALFLASVVLAARPARRVDALMETPSSILAPKGGDAAGPASCTRCSKTVSEHQQVRAEGRTVCLDCVLARYRRGAVDDTARADVSVDLLARLADGVLYD